MAQTSASPTSSPSSWPTDGEIAPRFAAALGPASVCAAAIAIPLFYLRNLHSIFFESKMALLYLAGAVGVAAQLLLRADPRALRVRLAPAMVGVVVALLATTILAGAVAVSHEAPGAPYAGLEVARLLAVAAVAASAARAAASPLWRRRVLVSIHVAGGLVSLLGLLQHLQILPLQIPTISVPGSTFGNRNVAAEAVAMSIPFGLAWLALAWPRGRPSAGETSAHGDRSPVTETQPDSPGMILLVLALELVYLGATRTRGAWLGATLGVVVFYALARRALPGAALGLVLALGVAALAAAVIPGRLTSRDVGDAKRFEPGEHVVSEALNPRSPVLRERLGLWRRTVAMWRAHPLLGVGPGNFQVYFPVYAEPDARADGVISAKIVSRHAHEDLLERLAETGPLGLAALLAVYGVGFTIAVRRSRLAAPDPGRVSVAGDEAPIAGAAAGSLAALFACGLSGFPLAMPATALLFAIALGFLACEGTSPAAGGVPSSGRRPPWPVAILSALVIVAGAAQLSARGLIRSYWHARALAALRPSGSDLGVALQALRAAEAASPGTFDVALETGYVLVRMNRFNDALVASDRALAAEPYAIPAWLLRGEASLGSGDPRGALAATDRALTLFTDYPDALAVRSLAETRLGHADAARAAHDHLLSLALEGDPHAKALVQDLRKEKGPP